MDIKLEDINQSRHGEYYVLDRKRLATATGIKLIDNHHLFAASFVGCRLYFISFNYETKESTIIDSIDTTLDDELVCPDLLDYNEINGCATIALSILEENSILLYELKDNKLFKKDQIKIPRKGQCHGVCLQPESNILLATSNHYNNYMSFSRYVCYIDMKKKKILNYVDYPFNVQSATFFNKKLILAGTNYTPRLKIGGLLPFKKLSSFVSIDGQDYEYKNTRVDDLAVVENKIYVTDQLNDCILVINFNGEVENTIEGMSFPHGVDVNEAYLAVSNYGTNTIKIVKIS